MLTTNTTFVVWQLFLRTRTIKMNIRALPRLCRGEVMAASCLLSCPDEMQHYGPDLPPASYSRPHYCFRQTLRLCPRLPPPLLAQVPPLILLAEGPPAARFARASFATCACRCSLIRLAASGASRQQNEDPMRLRQQPCVLWAGY